MNNPDDSRSTEQPKYYVISPPTLKKLASQEIVAFYYRYDFKNGPNVDNRRSLKWLRNWCREFRIKEEVGIDEKFLNSILERSVIWPVVYSIDFWITSNVKYVFFDSTLKTFNISIYLEDLVLKPNGSICYLNTAKNLLKGDKLNAVEKYRLACINCIADHVKSVWPSVSKNPRIYGNEIVYFLRDSLVDYWNDLMRDPPRLSDKGSKLLDSSIRCNVPAVDYFFDMFTEDHQTNIAWILIQHNTEYFIESMLLKLNKNERMLQDVMERLDPQKVLENLRLTTFLIPKVWNFLKYFIKGYHFLKIINFFVFRDDELLFYWDFSYPLLFEMWTTAPDHLKQFVLSDIMHVEDIFRNLNSYFYTEYSILTRNHDYYVEMRFFSTLLSDLCLELRKSLWRKYWRNLIVCSGPKFLDELMKLCFENEAEIIQFKKSEMMNLDNIDDFCYGMVTLGYVQELADFINFCSTSIDDNLAMDLKRKIVDSPRILKFFLGHEERFTACSKFINCFCCKCFAENFMKKIIESYEKVQKTDKRVDTYNF